MPGKVAEKSRAVERKRVEADPPEVHSLQRLLSMFENDTDTRWSSLIAMGDIYRHGAYPRFLPNEDMASECYKVCARCPDAETAGIAQTKYVESITDKIHDDDKEGIHLPVIFGKSACALALDRLQAIPYACFQRPRQMRSLQQQRQEQQRQEQQWQEQQQRQYQQFQQQVVARPAECERQNVHDHAVLNIAKANLGHISNATGANSAFEDVVSSVRSSIDRAQDVPVRQKSDALLVLNTLSSTEHSRFGVSEQQILAMVLQRIGNEPDDSLKHNMTETLIKQLASSIENGTTVCSTGKCVRMLGTFDGAESEMRSLVPLHILKDEIASLAAKTRDAHTANLDNEQKTQYEMGFFDQIMKDEFGKSCRELYIEQLGMSESILGPIIKLYEDAF